MAQTWAGRIGAFMDFAMAITGHTAGGPGKVAIVSSSLFGTVSGSAVANVMVDGPITIPLMKRTGFRPLFAAAMEAVASTGGLLHRDGVAAGSGPHQARRYEPSLLLIGDWVTSLTSFISASIGVMCFAAALQGYLAGRDAKLWERAVLLVAAFLLIKPGYVTDALDLALLAGVYLSNRFLAAGTSRPSPVAAEKTIE